jgi:hypothetical protein
VTTIPYVGARRLRRLALGTLLVRAVLSIALLVLVLAAAAAARAPRTNEAPFLPPAAGGIVVLDLSASITSDTYSRIAETLRQLVSRGGRYGLVVFSDDAYEAFPPGTPASALEPLIRYFSLPSTTTIGEQPTFPINPWTNSFTSGTEISAGLALAQSIERADGTRHPSVLLISDLADDQSDIQRLISVLSGYKANGVRLRVIALNAAPNDQAFFAGLIGNATAITPAQLSSAHPRPPAPPASSFPTLLVVLAAVVAVLLGIHELRNAKLHFGDSPAEATT